MLEGDAIATRRDRYIAVSCSVAVTGPLGVSILAVTSSGPAFGPNVSASVATPNASVVTVVAVSDPLASSENVTVTLGTAFPYRSTTLTVSGDESALPAAASGSALDRRLLQHGLMSAELRSALRARVLRDVIAPCAGALLTSERSAQATAAPV